MALLQPGFLLAAIGAAAIPWILHLLGRRRLPEQTFSDLRHLERLRATDLRALRIRQLLLLILRSAILFFIGLAFTRPVIGGIGSGPADVLLVVDRSASMRYVTAEGTLLEEALRQGVGLLPVLGRRDRVRLAVGTGSAGDPLSVLAEGWADAEGRRHLEEAAAGVSPSLLGTDGRSLLRQAAALLADTPEGRRREIVVISDFAGGSWRSEGDRIATTSSSSGRGSETPERTVSATSGRGARGAPGGRVVIVPMGSGTPRNRGITGIRLQSGLIEPRRPVPLEITIWNAGGEGEVEVSLELDGTSAANVRGPGGMAGESRLAATVVPTAFGVVALRARLTLEDRFPADDERWSALWSRMRPRVLLVSGQSAPDAPAVEAALRAGSESGWIRVSSQGPDAGTGAFPSSEIVVISGVPQPGEVLAEGIRAHLLRGGGVCLLLGPATDLAAWDRFLAQFAGIRLGGVVSAPEGSWYGLEPPSGEDTLAGPLFSGGMASPELGRIRRYVRLTAPTARPLLRLNDGSPAVIESAVREGRLMVWGVSPAADWGDLAMEGSTAPLMARAVRYLGRTEGRVEEIAVGAAPRLTVDAGRLAAEWVLRAPSGSAIPLAPEPGPPARITTGPLSERGVYTLLRDGEPESVWAVNLDPAESDLVPTVPAEVVVPEGWEVITLAGSGDRAPEMARLRTGSELWRFLLAAVLVLMSVEVVAARRAV